VLCMRVLLVIAVVSFAAGLSLLFAFCHGATGVQFAYPLSGASVHIDMTTTGLPAVTGFIATIVGAFLLVIATLIAIVQLLPGSGRNPVKRRESAFEE
jgi:TRAP-type C4-dicarboxylate transport system permease small subunit